MIARGKEPGNEEERKNGNRSELHRGQLLRDARDHVAEAAGLSPGICLVTQSAAEQLRVRPVDCAGPSLLLQFWNGPGAFRKSSAGERKLSWSSRPTAPPPFCNCGLRPV